MPEGDTIFRAARTLHRLMAGAAVTQFESVLPALNRVAEDSPLVGRTVDEISSRGKHLLMRFSGDLVLHTHMRMSGSWHVYEPGAPWKRPRGDMRVLIATADIVAVGFNIPVAEFIRARDLARHMTFAALGQDLLDPSFDVDVALGRIRARADTAIGDVLLDQRVVAGIGNMFKSEILFLAGTSPYARASSLTDERLRSLLGIAVEQLRANILTPAQTLSRAYGMRTTRSLDPNETLWVYGRAGKPCRRCGSPIESAAAGPDARRTYWCPSCQRERGTR
ncbi:MAG TPA: DNA-formamidopyrimidine glycosylase family protein [Vicinamibacterales bacterium]|jgi:endonuclease-8